MRILPVCLKLLFIVFFRITAKIQPKRYAIAGDSHRPLHAKKCGPGLSDPHCQHLMTRQNPSNSASFARYSMLVPER